jgi:hypothetical protein
VICSLFLVQFALVSGRSNIFRLQTFRAFYHIELHSLAFLEASEAASLERGRMHENVLSLVAANETVTFRIAEPLYRSLFCHTDCVDPFDKSDAGESEVPKGRLACKGENCSRPIWINPLDDPTPRTIRFQFIGHLIDQH